MANNNRILLSNYLQGAGFNNRNYIKNPSGFLNATQDIVLGAGAPVVTKNTSSPLTGISDIQAVFNSATSEYVEWTLDTLDRADLNGNCEFSGSYKLSLGSGATVQAQVYQGSNLAASLVLTATSASNRFLINVPCGDGSSATTVRFAQTVSTNTSTLNVAALYYGKASNVGSANTGAQLWGSLSYAPQASCEWQTTSTTFDVFAADTDCATPTVVGNAAAPGTKIPGVTFSSLPPGEYLVLASGTYGRRNNGVQTMGFQLWDGTTASGGGDVFNGSSVQINQMSTISGRFKYDTAQSNITFQIRAKAESPGTAALKVEPSDTEFRISVYRFPTQSEVAYRPDQVFKGGSVRYTGASNCSWILNTASYANFSADSDCSTPTASGDVSIPSTKIPGLLVNKLPAGRYLITATGGFAKNQGADYQVGWRFTDGTNFTPGSRIYVNDNRAVTMPIISGILETTSEQSNVTIQVQARDLDGGSNTATIDNANSGTDFQISIVPLSIGLPVPILVGSVTSNGTGAERIERLRVITSCTSSPCTIANQSGSWVSSITRNSIGNYTINVASGIFAIAPTCTAVQNTTAVAPSMMVMNATSTTAITTLSYDNTGNAIDNGFDVICMGPRS